MLGSRCISIVTQTRMELLFQNMPALIRSNLHISFLRFRPLFTLNAVFLTLNHRLSFSLGTGKRFCKMKKTTWLSSFNDIYVIFLQTTLQLYNTKKVTREILLLCGGLFTHSTQQISLFMNIPECNSVAGQKSGVVSILQFIVLTLQSRAKRAFCM